MRLLAFSDLHDDEGALHALGVAARGYDFVLACGDLSQNSIFAESALGMFPRLFIIPGNWENGRINRLLASSPGYAHERRIELGNGLNVVGFGFSNRTPFGTYGELGEAEIYERMSRLPIDGDTLLMLHCPPKGHFDEAGNGVHAGSESILRVITEKKPLAAFFGHIHEHAGVSKLGGTTLVKLPAASSRRACSAMINNKNMDAAIISV